MVFQKGVGVESTPYAFIPASIDICLGLAKHILHSIYHTNSRNAAKPRNQSFQDEKVKKMSQNVSNLGPRSKLSRGPHISENDG